MFLGAIYNKVLDRSNSLNLRMSFWNINKVIFTLTGATLGVFCCSINAEPVSNALPTGGSISSGDVIFTSEGSPTAPVLNINQSSQKAVLNWNSFDVGSQSTVNFNQPNTSSSTLNRIHSQSASEIHGRINATGEVLLVNENGILFGKNSRIDVGSIAASANNIKNADYLSDNYVFEEGDNESTVTNKGSIKTSLGGYAALLAPHVINEGIVTAQKGTVAFASGNIITLSVNDGSLTSLTVTPSKYNAFIENKYIVEAPGGRVILSATAVNQIRGGVIKQAGLINVGSTPTMIVNEAGRITISSNHYIATSESQTLASAENQGGKISIDATKTAVLEGGAVMKASATMSGDGGNISITSGEQLALGGNIEANGANEGNGGIITTHSPNVISVASSLAVFAKAGLNRIDENEGSWTHTANQHYIDTNTAEIISNTLDHASVMLVAQAGDIVIPSDVNVIKKSSNSPKTSLRIMSSASTSILGSISNNEATDLSVQLSALSTITLGSSAFIRAAEVSFEAERDINVLGDIYVYGSNNSSPLARFMGANVALMGAIYGGRQDSKSSTVRAHASKFLSTGPKSRIQLMGRDAQLNLSSEHELVIEGSTIQTNAGNGRGGTYTINALEDILISNATISSNASEGGFIRITSSKNNVSLKSSLIQTNGSSGRGGTIEIAGYNHTVLLNTSIQSNGSDFGGTIYLGNNIHTQAIPFSKYTFISSDSLIQALGLNSGGVVETSGHILDLLTLINVGRGGTWIIDPYDVTISSSGPSGTTYSSNFTPSTSTVILASSIEASLDNGTDVSITTGSNSANTLTVNAAINKTSGTDATLYLDGGTIDINAAISSSSGRLTLWLDGGTIDVSAPISLNDGILRIFNSGTSTLGGVFSEGNLLKYGNGELILTQANAYSRTYVIAGTLSISSDANLGALPASTTLNMIHIQGGHLKTTSDMTINSKRGIILNNANSYIDVADGSTLTYNGVISGSNSDYNLVLNNSATTGTLLLGGNNTYTGQTNINTGTLAVTVNDALGSNAAGTVIASGATLDLQNVNYTTTEAITNNGGTLATSTGTSAYAGVMTLGADSTVDVDGTQLTISTAIGDGSGGYAITKDGNGTLVLSATSTYTGDTTISAGTLKLTGNLDSATDLVIAPSATLDLQAALTAATLDLDGTISNTAGTSSLIISGTSSLGGSITTTGTQTYNNAVTLTGDTTLATSSAQVTFAANATINSEGSETNNLTITASETELNGVIGYTRTLGVIDINGNLDLNAAITNATSMDVSGTANLGADVTTSGNQTYTGDITLSADVGLNTSGGDVQIDGDVNTALVSGGSESGIIQFLGNGSYQYSADGGITYNPATATSSATAIGSGSLTYSAGSYTWTTPDNIDSTKLLVVAGGGGGGYDGAGGGGAGGLIYNTNYSISANTDYTVTVGAGGAAATTTGVTAGNGVNSVFDNQTAIGGGGGGSKQSSGASGGSGGGGGHHSSSTYAGGNGTVGQGNAGGRNSNSSGGGGGGAGGVGSNASGGTGGNGGAGLSYDISGSPQYYAAGGAGGTYVGSGGTGGSNIGGDACGGSGCSGIDTSATQNTGSGGGSNGNIGAGGSSGAGATGIVVVNYSYNSATYAEYDLSINTGAGDIDVNGALANLGELNLTSTSAGSEISGIISTDTIVNKAGVGSLTLSSNNTYTGLTNIDVGTIIATHANALGATSAGTVVDSGAALAVSGGLTVAEPVSLSGTGVASAGALSLISGNNTYSGAITLAADTLIKSTAGTPTLSATINGGYALTTVASDALTVSGVIGGTTPLTKVNLSTTSGNLTLGNNIAVAGTGTDAMIFNAGSSTAAGTTTGGNIILSGSPTLTTGDGGRITFYTGSVSGSTGLTSLIGSGTHRFRYNSDETTTNYTATLSSGSYAIYREQPTLTVTAENEALTYGTTPTPTVTISGMQNGDANGTVVTTAASISIGGATSTSGNYTAGSHTITPSAAASTYGYGFDYDAGTLTVAQYDLTATIATVSATYGAGVDAGSVSLNQIGDDVVGVTASIVSPVYSNASKLKAGSYSQITGVTANLTGADAANYTLSATTRANSVSVAPKAITYDIAAGNITYGAADSAGSISYSALETGDVVSASAQIDDRALSTAGKLEAGTYTQSINGSHAGVDKDNYTITLGTANNYVVGKQAITYDIAAGNITYGAADSAGSISYSALETGDVVSASAQIDDRALSTAGKLEAGTYTQSINGSHAGVDKDNYTITLGTANNYVVGKQAITYDIAAGNITYGAADSAGSISYSALETGDVVSASAQIDDRALSTAGKLEAGTYTQSINGSHAGVDKDNYTITLGTANNYVVGKQAITYDIAAGNITYGAADSAGSISYSALETGDVVSASAQIDDRALSTAGKLEAGTYTQSINGSHAGVDKDNYTITLGTANNYVVGKQAITYDIAAGNITYGAADSAGSISYSALETGDVVSASAQIDDRALSTAGKLEAGTYTQSINGSHAGVDKDNYTITLGTANNYVVGKQAITYDIAAGNITYGAADSAGSISYSALETGDVVSASAQIDDRALSTAGKLEAGTYTQSINGSHAGVDKDNYTITLGTANNYVVGKQAITYDIAAGNITYGAADSAGSISYSALETGDVVSASAQIDDRALSTAGKLEAGTYTQSINGSHAGVDKDNYTITLGTANNYVVGKQAITYDIAAGNITYGAADSAGSISYSALETGDVVSASAQIDDRALSTAGKLEAGTYTQSINGSHAGVDKDNYTITLGTANNYVVGKQAITYDIAAGNITYGAADSAGSISYSALETGDVVSASAQIDDRALSTAGKLEAGTYTQSINGSHAGVDKDNYTITLGTANNYVVGKQAITYDIAAGNITYGAADSAGSISYSALETGDVVSASAQIDDRALSTAGKLEAGTYTQSINGSHAGVDKDNYTITLGTANNYVVGKQAITYDIAAGNITYGAADSAGSISYSALETGDVVSASAQIDDRALSTAGKLEAGTYTQSINGSHAGVDKDNYTITLGTANNYVVGKQAITYDIAAGNITYGAADSAGSISYSALETGDVVSASAQIDDRALSTAGKLEAGTYTQSINGSHAGVDKDNYTITLGTANNYVVGKQAITYDIAAGNITYGAADSAGSISYSALETGDVVSASAQIDDRALSTAGKLEAGTYTQSINGSHAGVDKDNYTITLGTANNYVVGKQAITYDIAAGNITYGAADSAGSISYSALETGDVVSASAQIDDRALSTAGKLEAGTYTQSINGSHAGVDKDNYTITLGTANNYTVNAKAITVSGINAESKVYNGNTEATIDVSLASFTDLVDGDTVTVSATGTFSDKNVDTGKIVTLSETYAGTDRNNYTITSTSQHYGQHYRSPINLLRGCKR